MSSVDYDALAHVQASETRVDIIEQLQGDGAAYPTQLASELDIRLPHVSRALTSLREDDLVELLVDESRTKFRYYDLTQKGENVATHLTNDGADAEQGGSL